METNIDKLIQLTIDFPKAICVYTSDNSETHKQSADIDIERADAQTNKDYIISVRRHLGGYSYVYGSSPNNFLNHIRIKKVFRVESRYKHHLNLINS